MDIRSRRRKETVDEGIAVYPTESSESVMGVHLQAATMKLCPSVQILS